MINILYYRLLFIRFDIIFRVKRYQPGNDVKSINHVDVRYNSLRKYTANFN